MSRAARPTAENFWSHVEITPTCWLWTGAIKKRQGYGVFRSDGRTVRAHRFCYEAIRGDVPQDLDLDHLCRVRRCVNPAHLEPVTRRVNLVRGDTLVARAVAKTHCLNGHRIDDESNVYRQPSRPSRRSCRTCMRAREAARAR